MLRERRIVFEIATDSDLFYSEANIERLKKSIEQIEKGSGEQHDLIEED